MSLGLKDKTAIVTGGSKGIGKAIAVAFAKEGTNVVICGRGEGALRETAAEIERLGGNVLAVQADLTKQSDVEHLVSSAIDRFKSIDILVNNAGIASGFDDFETLDIEAWQHIFDVNVFGTVRVTKAVIPFMKKPDLDASLIFHRNQGFSRIRLCLIIMLQRQQLSIFQRAYQRRMPHREFW